MRLRRIHLDPVGGIAGDMFAAAMADAFPEQVPGLLQELARLGPPPSGPAQPFELPAYADGALTGRRFVVPAAAATPPHQHAAGGDAAHAHVAHRDIRARLAAAGLDPEVLRHALGLFAVLAQAEAQVHGVAPEEVGFHEAGAWDSIADFVAAACFIARLAPARWTCGPLPLGGGRVRSAHGVLPVPAPATARLLQGLEVLDDGVPGERVTPTGAAIVRYVLALGADRPFAREAAMTLARSGHGFGSRRLAGVPNVLRVMAFAPQAAATGPGDEELATLRFEIDDQTAEDLAVALERIREAPGVLDACQLPVFGKKGRMATQVQVLARPEAADAVVELCLAQTTTLGVRIGQVRRRVLAREQVETRVPESVRVKVARRADGATAKAEIDDLAAIPGVRLRREAARRRAEAAALQAREEPDAGDA